MLTVLLVLMEKMMLAEIKKITGLVLLFISFISIAETPIKKLYFQYNDKVVIWITNQPCIDKKINKISLPFEQSHQVIQLTPFSKRI